ncbi:hypothetical protein WJX72_004488 [[Myrmecia] bisecta]|uniref:Pathogen-related protein n=1 Tax=[Myrmecia] bisecta TaxID=41462 RepID=A0AAW1PGV3_9CHLO
MLASTSQLSSHCCNRRDTLQGLISGRWGVHKPCDELNWLEAAVELRSRLAQLPIESAPHVPILSAPLSAHSMAGSQGALALPLSLSSPSLESLGVRSAFDSKASLEPSGRPSKAAPFDEAWPQDERPDYLWDPNAVLNDKCAWRKGHSPDYSVANNKYAAEAKHRWQAGSLEDLVSNLVKNWEKEASHKVKGKEWRTVDMPNYTFSTNGGAVYTAAEMIEIGTYNALIGEHAYYSAQNTGFEESHDCFRKALPTGFAWEVTDVTSGPPRVSFKWRHWGTMTGKLVCPLGLGRTLEAEPTFREVEIFGMCIVDLNKAYQITNIEVFYDPHQLLGAMVEDFCPLASKAAESKFIIDLLPDLQQNA